MPGQSATPIAVPQSTAPTAAPSGPLPLELEPINQLLAADIAKLNALIPAQLTSNVDLVEDISRYIVSSGGKRLRPTLVLLGAGVFGNTSDHRYALAAAIEFLHTATLLHDDVVDRSNLRRGKQTANAVWGNAPSVLVGDFVYSRAFQLMVTLNDLDILRVLSNAINTIAEGEVLQLARVGDLKLDEAQYMEVIRCKTALLFEAATQTSAMLSGAPAEHVEALRRYGEQFGLAYQLMDDYLDYAGDAELMGKNVGDDLAEGKVTLPLIFGLANAPKDQSAVIEHAIAERAVDQLDAVVAIVRECGALAYTQHQAANRCREALSALAPLPPSPYKDGLANLAEYSLARIS